MIKCWEIPRMTWSIQLSAFPEKWFRKNPALYNGMMLCILWTWWHQHLFFPVWTDSMCVSCQIWHSLATQSTSSLIHNFHIVILFHALTARRTNTNSIPLLIVIIHGTCIWYNTTKCIYFETGISSVVVVEVNTSTDFVVFTESDMVVVWLHTDCCDDHNTKITIHNSLLSFLFKLTYNTVNTSRTCNQC